MKRQIQVCSTVIDWQAQCVEITATSGEKHTIPLDKRIHVTMIGYPDRMEEDMLALSLAGYMRMGYIIEQISWQEE